MATHSEQRLSSKDGIELFTQKWTVEKAQAEVLILHGFLEHSSRYEDFGTFLCSFGINVTTYDQRGHGLSGGRRAFCKSYQEYTDDLDLVLSTVNKNRPRFVLAHSNGSLTALLWSEKYDTAKSLSGLVILSPWLAPAADLPYVKVVASRVLGSLLPTLTIPAELKSEDLMHDKEKIKAHKEDKLLLEKFCVGWAKESMKSQAHARKLTALPNISSLLFIYAGDDKIASTKENSKLANQLDCSDKTVIEKVGQYHEILNESERQETYLTIKDWILERTKGRS
jgi:alpha-beta hydrolase superfamily lysophospholipase